MGRKRSRAGFLDEPMPQWALFVMMVGALVFGTGVAAAASIGWGVSQGMAGPTLETSTIDQPGYGILKSSNYLLTPTIVAQHMGSGVL